MRQYYYTYLHKKLINFTFTDNDLNKECQKQLDEDDCEKQSYNSTFKCYHLKQITRSDVEDCTEPETYDYFSNSESSFILTFIGVGIVILGKK
jgi:dual oxidase